MAAAAARGKQPTPISPAAQRSATMATLLAQKPDASKISQVDLATGLAMDNAILRHMNTQFEIWAQQVIQEVTKHLPTVKLPDPPANAGAANATSAPPGE